MINPRRRWGALFLLAVFFFQQVTTLPAAAVIVGNTYFENVGNGNVVYIPDSHADTNSITGSVMPNRSSSRNTADGAGAIGTEALGIDADESDQRVRKQALYDLLKNKNTGGSTWERMGSASIVHQMLGESWGSGGRTISAEDWTTLYNRLVENDNIRMERQFVSRRYNTSGVFVQDGGSGDYNIYDTVRYTYSDDMMVDAWVFTSGESRVYALQIICANPLGTLSGFPEYVPDPDEYELEPSANSNGVSVVEPGGEILVDGVVENIGDDASPGNEWKLIEVVYGPSTDPSTDGGENATEPCTFVPSNSSCEEVDSGTDTVFLPGEPTPIKDDYEYTVPETAEVGTRICFMVSVKPFSNLPGDQERWRHSELHCVIIAKSPKMQVWGGDVRSGGKIDTGIRTFSGPLTYGSWGEYGVLSRENNSGFASGSGLNNGDSSSAQSSWDMLTFANTGVAPSGCSFGCYNFALSSGALVGQFDSGSGATSLGSNTSLNSLNGRYSAGNLNISSSTITSGRSIIIVATGTVTIRGDIRYDNNGPSNSGYTNARDIPQVVIHAPTIRIQGNVEQVDAWLLAVNSSNNSGALYTCYGGTGGVTSVDDLTSENCNTPLTINGPVVADRVYLWRTAGSGGPVDERGDPAEIFNLRADAYLWAHSYGSSRGRIQTVHTRELSPRF